MTLAAEYRGARREEDLARLRRILAPRAMVADGMSQRLIAEQLGISQPAVSQQLKAAQLLDGASAEALVQAAAPVLKALAADRGYTRLAVFGSVARRETRPDSDVDLVVEAPPGTSSFDFVRFQHVIEQVVGRQVDLIAYGGLRPGLDDDIRREAILL